MGTIEYSSIYTIKTSLTLKSWSDKEIIFNSNCSTAFLSAWLSDIALLFLSNQIYFESNEDIEPYLLEDFIDPDNDGNYPIILSDNQEYLIFGKELNIIKHN